ncbi:hypothetical protein R6Q59_029799, partial [Mikania micrantha]
KTIDCHSPGQGLMTVSLKVHTVPLDGDDSANGDILDTNFGKASIGRVAHVGSVYFMIVVNYIVASIWDMYGDLSVQERIDVQTGTKIILKLCLANDFDMFPTLHE